MTHHAPTQDVFDLVLAQPLLTPDGEHPCLVLLSWIAPRQGDRLVQVYLDGQLIDVSDTPAQRRLLLYIDRALPPHPRRIELLAVSARRPDDLWCPMPSRLRSWSPTPLTRAALAVLRDPLLPLDALASVSVDDNAPESAPLWDARQHRGGFGALFGHGPFGYDNATSPGLGRGELGAGPLGADGSIFRWERHDLPAGTHQLHLRVTNAHGHPVAQPLDPPALDILPLPAPARDFTIAPGFTLTWSA